MADDKGAHWADRIADEIIKRVSENPELKKITDKNGYIVYDEKTPSGKIHIGSGRGWVIHDVIAKALRDKGVKARFILSSDDMDPYDKPNKDLDSSWDKYLGMPFRDIPSPVEGYKSFGDYYFSQVTDKFEEFGIVCELESTGERYEKGDFNRTIKIALDNAEKIKQIYKDLYGDDTVGANRFPINIKCEKCGKIGTTLAYEWDPKREVVKYKCLPDFVSWAKGCGHEGEISPYDGNSKFPWKVEWPAKWPTVGVVAETAGKDHFTKGGSRTIACRIAKDVFNFEAPWPSRGYSTGKGYEFFTVGGKKMSTSKGRGMGFADSTDYAPASMLRFLLVKTRPNAVIDFQPYDSNDIILLYERYDKAERVYFGIDDMGEKENEKLKRIYELSHVGKIPKKIPPQIPFSHAAVLVQIFPDEDKVISCLKETGHLDESLDADEIAYVKERIGFARKWVKEFAPEQYRFQLQESVPEDSELSDLQKKALKQVAALLRSKIWDEKELFNEFYKICKEDLNLETKEFFKAAYKVLLNKEKGPKLAGFLIAVKDRAIKLFEEL